MCFTVKEVLELLMDRVNGEFSDFTIAGNLERELGNSIILGDYLDSQNISIRFDSSGTHFFKL